MFFILNVCGENGFYHCSVLVSDINHLFCKASDILKCSKQDLSLFLFVDGTLIDENDYLKTLEPGTELIVSKSDQKDKLLIFFDIKRYCSAECQ